MADIDCDLVVPALVRGTYYPNSTLLRGCTSSCEDALGTYQTSVEAACISDTWLGYENETMPVAIIPEILRYNYNLTCLANDDGDFCNNVAASYAAYLDPNATAHDGQSRMLALS